MGEQRGAVWANAWREALRNFADPARWRRGTGYFQNAMVVRLFIVPGRLVGKVEGSRARPYDVQISVPMMKNLPLLRMLHFLLDNPETMHEVLEHVPQLIPDPRHTEFLCSCSDWSEACKHVVALWLEAAERFAEAPEQLLRFRGILNEGPTLRLVGSELAAAARQRSGDDQPEVPHTVDAQRFWEGDPEALDRLLSDNGDEPIGPPAWVFSPPAPWPERGMSFSRLMERIYANFSGTEERKKQPERGDKGRLI